MSDLERDMISAMRDWLGDGYTLDYYQSAASEFISIAESHAHKLEERVKELELKLQIDEAINESKNNVISGLSDDYAGRA